MNRREEMARARKEERERRAAARSEKKRLAALGPAERVLGTKRVRSPAIDFDAIQTRPVLAGAYRGRDISARELLTHLIYRKEGQDVAIGCRQPLENIADEFAYWKEEELHMRPTCKICAKKWDKLKAEWKT